MSRVNTNNSIFVNLTTPELCFWVDFETWIGVRGYKIFFKNET